MNDGAKVSIMQAMALLEGALRAQDVAVARSLLSATRNAVDEAIAETGATS